MKNLRIVSYNIHKGFSAANSRFVLPEMAQELARLDADFMLLQEAVGENRKHVQNREDWPEVCQTAFLAGEEFSHFVYGKNAVYEHGHHGNAILSRFPVKRWHNQNVSTNWLESRGALHAVVDVDGVELHLINLHLSLFESGRRNQVRLVANRIRNEIPHGAPFVVAGDFNDWRRTAGELFERMLGVRDAFSHTKGSYARSFPSIVPILSLDRVYFSGLQCVSAQALSGPPWSRFSDHLPLVVELALSS